MLLCGNEREAHAAQLQKNSILRLLTHTFHPFGAVPTVFSPRFRLVLHWEDQQWWVSPRCRQVNTSPGGEDDGVPPEPPDYHVRESSHTDSASPLEPRALVPGPLGEESLPRVP